MLDSRLAPAGSQTLGYLQPKPLTCIQPLATHRQFLAATRKQIRGEHSACGQPALADDHCSACWWPSCCLTVSGRRLLASQLAPAGIQALGYSQTKSGCLCIQLLTTTRQFPAASVRSPATKLKKFSLSLHPISDFHQAISGCQRPKSGYQSQKKSVWQQQLICLLQASATAVATGVT